MPSPADHLSVHGAPTQTELVALAPAAPESLVSDHDPTLAPCDDPRMRIRMQTIPAAEMLPLTFGAWWSVRREGTDLNSDWDWELRMEIWGCHDYGTGVPPAG